MAVRRSTWLALHGFDERFGGGAPLRACEEIDFVMRALTAGTHVYETMNAAVVHSEFRTWAESPRDVYDHLHGIGAVLVKSLKSRHVGAAAATAGLGLRRLMAKRVAHLGKQPHRTVRLLGLASGVRSGLETSVDQKTGHFQACVTAHEGGGPLLDEGAIMHARAEALAKHAIGEVLILDRSPAQLEPNASSAQVERVAIVVPNWNARPFLERALRSLVTHTTHAYELIIVDNGSTDGSKELIREFVRTHPDVDAKFVDHSDNLYFSTAVNIGLRAASSNTKYLALYCNDVEATADTWLQELVNAIQPEAVVAAGHSGTEPITDRQRGVFVSYDPVYPDPAVKRHILDLMGRRHATYHHVYGYCVLFKRALLERTGLYLHTGPFRQYHSDWELCLRFAAMGYQIAPVATKVHHWHSVSELLAFHPELYTRLLDRVNDPTTRELDLKQGRPFYEVESGFHSLYSTVFSRTLERMKRRLRQR